MALWVSRAPPHHTFLLFWILTIVFSNLVLFSDLHTVNIKPKNKKEDSEDDDDVIIDEKCTIGQVDEDSEEINADLKYFLNQTSGIYIESNHTGTVVTY